jgi:hypothetical protein
VPTNRVGFTYQQQALQCVAKATTCEKAGACFPLETMNPNDPRCWQPEGGTVEAGVCPDAGDGGDSGDAGDAGCTIEAGPTEILDKCADDGGTVLKCQGTVKYALHCNTGYYAPGSSCVADVDDTRWCALGTDCNVFTSCLGLTLDYCGGPASFVHESVNCTYAGRSCGEDLDSGKVECLAGDSIKSCNVAGADCHGDIVAVCDGITLSEFDCASLQGTCSKQQGVARCVRSTDSCTPFDQSMNTCAGNVISLCVGGQATSFDCSLIGMTCKPGAGAQSGHCG